MVDQKILAKDIMTSPVFKINEDKSIQDAAILMSRKRISCLIVTKKGKPVGIITDSDIIKKVVAKNVSPKKTKVKDIATYRLIYCRPEDEIGDVILKMKKWNVRRIPVIANKKVVGIITTTDIARTIPELIEIIEIKKSKRKKKFKLEEETLAGICDECGGYSEELKYVNGKWLCESCRENYM